MIYILFLFFYFFLNKIYADNLSVEPDGEISQLCEHNSKWSDWSDCDVKCGTGKRSRKRAAETDDCQDLLEIESCELPDCPVNCLVSEWSSWTDCDNFGNSSRTREVVQFNNPYGVLCPTLEDIRRCDVDCVTGVWGDWSQCTATCDGGTQFRSRSVQQARKKNGAECPNLTEVQSCNTEPCSIDCLVSDWLPWGECGENVNCGSKSSQSRKRDVVTAATLNGIKCESLYEERACETAACSKNCILSDWGEWTLCMEETGTRTRIRRIIEPAMGDGKNCDALAETGICAVDCIMTDWGDWEECSSECQGGFKGRSRMIHISSKNGGKACGETSQAVKCNEQPCPITECLVTNWTEWVECTKNCGGGIKTRERSLISASNINDCPVLNEKKSCNNMPCPVDCEMGEWSSWSVCSADCYPGGIRERSRKIIKNSQFSGKKCPSPHQYDTCNEFDCPVDCIMSSWSPWSSCSDAWGIESRFREKVTDSVGSGKQCPDTAEETRSCSVNCRVSEWGEWSNCTEKCGGGFKSRVRFERVAALNNGQVCPPLQERTVCNTYVCPKDCQVSEWSNWTLCPQNCENGIKTRNRNVTQSPQGTGANCPTLTQQVRCTPQGCLQDCEVSDWGVWGSCSASECGEEGRQIRRRFVTVAARMGGASCPSLEDVRACKRDDCQKCEVSAWSDWSVCSKPCDGGLQSRSRSIINRNEKSTCPLLTEEQTCNIQKCPMDCIVTEWTPWGVCSKKCGGGVQDRSREILRQSYGNGKECGLLIESKKCNEDLPVCADKSYLLNCECICPGGHKGNPYGLNGYCDDINECEYNPCGNTGAFNCINTKGSYICECLPGYRGSSCVDVDECIKNPCSYGASCINNAGGFECICLPGLQGDPYGTGCSLRKTELGSGFTRGRGGLGGTEIIGGRRGGAFGWQRF
eukprot:GHVL01034698.1.p1 GENE.GHVL01034698.1~~GHVL01034698.1.p1  ORF type:complete len:923 (-),score=209.86 GHVL01034698.1:1791-4559(-)